MTSLDDCDTVQLAVEELENTYIMGAGNHFL